MTIIIFFIGLYIYFQYFLETVGTLNIFSYLGIVLLIPSIILFTIARIQLGDAFQASAKANKLVKTGIYKKVRHPIYLFGIIFFLGIIFITQMFFLLIFLAVLILLQINRIKKEEKVLTEKFGNEYLEYKKQTWF